MKYVHIIILMLAARIGPQSIIAFLESLDYEDAVRKAVSLGGTVILWPVLQDDCSGILQKYQNLLLPRPVNGWIQGCCV